MLRKFFGFDFIFFFTVLLLIGFGIIALGSIFLHGDNVSGEIFLRHIVYVIVAIIVFIIFAFIDYNALQVYSTFFYFFSIGLLILTLILGSTFRGTSGWLNLGFAYFQPVELIKILIIIFLAHFISKKRGELGEMMMIIASFVLTAIIVLLVLKQPDFGSALVILGIWFIMIFVSGIRKKYLLVFVVAGVLFSIIAWTFFAPYQRARIIDFLHPELDPQGSGYNVIQSMIAVGNGGLIGKGFGYGSQSQLNFLPEKHTDFIFATIAESIGFVGVVVLFGLFGVLFLRFYFIAHKSRNAFGYFLVVGTMAMLFIHFAVNIGMNIGLMPVTGIPLPLISYGGSSLLSVMISCGMVMSVYLRREVTMKNYIESY